MYISSTTEIAILDAFQNAYSPMPKSVTILVAYTFFVRLLVIL